MGSGAKSDGKEGQPENSQMVKERQRWERRMGVGTKLEERRKHVTQWVRRGIVLSPF